MNFRVLRYFLSVAEEMNFRRAADKLYITQQTLSVHIQKLEKYYGVQFFERRPRLKLTPAGEALAEYARRMLLLEKSFLAELADCSNEVKGRLNVGISGIRGTIFIPRIWERFHRQFPNISLNIIEGGASRLDALLCEGKLDLYIGVDVPLRNDVVTKTLSVEKACLCASRNFVENYFNHQDRLHFFESGISLLDIAEMPMVAFSAPNSIRKTLDEYYATHGIHPNIIIETSRHDLVLRFCELGYGIGVIYQMILYGLLQNTSKASDLCVFPLKDDFLPKYTSLVYRQESFKPRYFTGFLQITENVFNDYAEHARSIIIQADTKVRKTEK